MELILFILSVITVKTLPSLSLCSKEKEQRFLRIISVLCIVAYVEARLWHQDTKCEKGNEKCAPRIGTTLSCEMKYCCRFMK
jgi:hypothetical protein